MYENTGAWENELKGDFRTRRQGSCFRGKRSRKCRQSFCCIRDTCQSRRKNRERRSTMQSAFLTRIRPTPHIRQCPQKYILLYAAMGSKTAFVDPEILADFRGDIRRFLKGKTGIRTIPETVSRDPPLKRALPFSRDGKAACNDS